MLDRRAFLGASAAAVAAPALAAIPAPIHDDAIWINQILREEGYLHLPAATYTLRSPIQIIGAKLMMDEGSEIKVAEDYQGSRHLMSVINVRNGGQFWSRFMEISAGRHGTS